MIIKSSTALCNDYGMISDLAHEEAEQRTMCIHSRSSLLDSENENSETASFHAAI